MVGVEVEGRAQAGTASLPDKSEVTVVEVMAEVVTAMAEGVREMAMMVVVVRVAVSRVAVVRVAVVRVKVEVGTAAVD